MRLGDRILSKGMTGADVIELQIRLAGFRGTIWDGIFGPGVELQVTTFQKDYMQIVPTGIVNAPTITALVKFTQDFPINFNKLKCPCGTCDGFGHGQYKGYYESGKPQIEAYYRYEYPGIHKAIIHSFRALWFYGRKAGFGETIINCGYRCWVNNAQNNRTSTNHMGKAIDCDFPLKPGEDKRADCDKCNSARGLLIEKSNFQVGWYASNVKALEPSDIAPTWVHMDVRQMTSQYLNDIYFVKNAENLDSLIIK
jgi:hypothetical protein